MIISQHLLLILPLKTLLLNNNKFNFLTILTTIIPIIMACQPNKKSKTTRKNNKSNNRFSSKLKECFSALSKISYKSK